MANRKKQKYPTQKKVLADARRYVIRSGEYNGATDSGDFMVSGHSTGSPYSEMEELSEQVTRDAGGYDYQEPQLADDRSDTGYDMYQGEGLGDLGGPELYGDRYAVKAPRSRGLMIGAAIGLAATALFGGLAYLVYQSEEEKTVRHARKTGGRAVAKGRTSASSARSDETATPKKRARASTARSSSRPAAPKARAGTTTKSRGGKRSSAQPRA